MTRKHVTRRGVLASIGGAVTVALTGCLGGGDDSVPDKTIEPASPTPTPVPTVESQPSTVESRVDEFSIDRTELTADGFVVEVTNEGSEKADLANYALVVDLIRKRGGYEESVSFGATGSSAVVRPGGSVTVTIPVSTNPGELAWYEVVLACPGAMTGDAVYCSRGGE